MRWRVNRKKAETGIDFSSLRPFRPRRFVPEDAVLTDKQVAVSLYQQLLQRDVTSQAEMEQLILDRSELEAAVAQQKSILYIQMTCRTDDCTEGKSLSGLY